ncbi:hypothetical protein, partial [Fusobacterium necrophorum]|uniref:hypothetical protein n=1 Tax=Fusobacterium necrophorum TaxID=859 RepID=UPI00056CAFDF
RYYDDFFLTVHFFRRNCKFLIEKIPMLTKVFKTRTEEALTVYKRGRSLKDFSPYIAIYYFVFFTNTI